MDFIGKILDSSKEDISTSTSINMGIAIGIVKENWDSEHQGMVKVEYIIGTQGESTTDWIRVMTSYSGIEYGIYMLPEIGTEVVIAFQNGDLHSPIVLGCLYNDDDKIKSNIANENNSIKCITTKTGHEILLDETQDNEKIEIKTKAGLDILLEDNNKKITIKDIDDKNSAIIDGNSGEITLKADKKIIFNVGGEDAIILDGSSKKAQINSNSVEIEGKQSLDLKGQSSSFKGSVISIKGDSSIEIKSSGMTQISGNMTKIN